MKPLIVVSLLASMLVSAPAQARIMALGSECASKETVTLGITFNRKSASFVESKTAFETQMKNVEDIAKQQQLKKFTLENQNYNISAQPQSYTPDGMTPLSFIYQMNGNVSYQLDNADAALKLAESLTKEHKMVVNLSSNANRQGNCAIAIN